MGTEKEMSTEGEGEAYPMKGGDGAYSYSRNSSYQVSKSVCIKILIDRFNIYIYPS